MGFGGKIANLSSQTTHFLDALVSTIRKTRDRRKSEEKRLLHKRIKTTGELCTYEGNERYQIRNTCIQYVKRLRPTHVLLSKMISSSELSNSVTADGAGICKTIESLVNVDLRARINQSDVAACEVNVKNVDACLQIGKMFLRCIYI